MTILPRIPRQETVSGTSNSPFTASVQTARTRARGKSGIFTVSHTSGTLSTVASTCQGELPSRPQPGIQAGSSGQVVPKRWYMWGTICHQARLDLGSTAQRPDWPRAGEVAANASENTHTPKRPNIRGGCINPAALVSKKPVADQRPLEGAA